MAVPKVKIVLFGASGQLGKSFQKYIINNKKKFSTIRIFFYDKKEANITKRNEIKKIISSISPNFIINCGAYTNVDNSEEKITIAKNINSLGPKLLAKISYEFDVPLIHFSTDYVYDGKKRSPYNEKDLLKPLNIYGKTKLDGEKNIINNTNKYIILRLSWLFSEFPKSNFVNFIFGNYFNEKVLNIIDDQFGRPTYCEDVVKLVIKIISKIQISDNYYGIYNFSSRGPAVSWYQYSKKIINYMGKIHKHKIKPNKIKGISLKNYNKLNKLSTKRPKYSVLDYKKVNENFKIKTDDWRSSLFKTLKNL